MYIFLLHLLFSVAYVGKYCYYLNKDKLSIAIDEKGVAYRQKNRFYGA